MNQKVRLETLLAGVEADRIPEYFALFNLGVVDSLRNGLLDAEDAVRFFYHADNSLYVKDRLANRSAGELMGRGAQLADLFDALPAGEARREFLRELATMHELCLKLIEEQQSVA